MALPQDGQNANALATVKEVPTGKKLIFVDPTTNEGGIITLEDLTTQILKKLTSQTFALDQGTKTLPAALNELNSNALRSIDVDYGDITIDNTGFTNLASKMPQTGTVRMATIKYYENIFPINAINIYAVSNESYVFGTPNTTIKNLIVRYWYIK